MLYISEQDVLELLPMPKAINLTRAAFAALADKSAQNQPRRRLTLPNGSTLHQLAGAYGQYFGAKIYSTSRAGAYFMVLLYDSETATPLALIEANHLGQIRTGAVSGLATDLMASQDAATLGVIGTGFQAETQVEAILAVRRIERVKVWSRKPDNRNRFAEQCSRKFGVPTAAVVSAEEAVGGVDIVATATFAKDPVFQSDWVKAGVHINAAGSNKADRRELPPEILEKASLIAVDSFEQAGIEAGDLILGLGKQFAANPKVVELAGLVAAGQVSRKNGDTTIFKSVGLGVQDIAVAGFVYEESLRLRKGSELPLFHS